jgi:hypothetical protein
MTKEEAIRIATAYLQTDAEALGSVLLSGIGAAYLPAEYREGQPDSDAWAVSFPYRLPAGVETRDPADLIIEVDIGSGKARFMMSL